MTTFNSDNCIIVGDMNIDVFDLNNFDYTNLIHSYGFEISNSYRTRPISGTLLDHFVINFGHKFSVHNHTIDNDFSDHSMIVSEIDLSASNESKKITKRSKFVNFEKFKSNLNSFSIEECYVPDDVNSLCEFLIRAINTSELTSTSNKTVQKRRSCFARGLPKKLLLYATIRLVY